MSLVTRLRQNTTPDTNDKLPVHTFYAALAEFAAGQVTRQQIVDYFGLDAAEDAELGVIIDAYQSAPNDRKQEFLEFIHRIFILAEEQVPGYTTNGQLNTRLQNF